MNNGQTNKTDEGQTDQTDDNETKQMDERQTGQTDDTQTILIILDLLRKNIMKTSMYDFKLNNTINVWFLTDQQDP
jgi:hypothetical protein